MSLETCSICIQECNPRGGHALVIPACCGKTYHQSCLTDAIQAGNTSCPDCRNPFPANTVNNIAAPARPTNPRPTNPFFGQALAAPNSLGQAAPPASTFNFFSNAFSFGQAAPTTHRPPLPISTPRRGGRQGRSTDNLEMAQPGFEDDLPMQVEGTSASSTASSATGEINIMTLCTPERRTVSTSAIPSFYSTIEVQYINTATRKNPIDVVCVLDTSGSMQMDSKLTYLKKAMDFIIDTLQDGDRLSVVDFNSSATTLHGLVCMTAANKVNAKSFVSQLNAGGGTDIMSGMQEGWRVLTNRRHVQDSCMFLLTDGQDGCNSNRHSKLELAKEIMNGGTALMVFGFGQDHDSDLMGSIANAAEGSFTYIDTPDTVIDAFGGAIGSQQGVSLKNVNIVTSATVGTSVNSSSSGIYTSTVSADQRQVTTRFAQLYPGEKRTILLDLTLASTDSWMSTVEVLDQDIFNVAGQYEGVQDTGRCDITSVPCLVNRVAKGKIDEASQVRNLEVDAEINRVKSNEATTKALSLADKGDFAGAKKILEDALAAVKASSSFATNNAAVLALIEDLDDCLKAVGSRESYRSGGRAEMTECFSKQSAQRSHYTKAGKSSHYQSPTSFGMQSSACASKSGGGHTKSK